MTTGDLILAADFGTSGVKLGAVDGDFRLVAQVIEPYPLSLPAPSCAEQAPDDWWSAFCRGTARLAGEVEGLADRLAAVSLCAQMCGLVCADGNGAVLRPALVWLDKRSAPLMRRVLGGFPEVSGYNVATLARWIRVSNGAPSHNGMDPTGKMLWVMREEPEVAKAARFLDVKDWLVHRATGVFCTTADSANLTWLMDTRKGREGWSDVTTGRLGIARDKLPTIVEGTEVVGELTDAAAAQTGLRTGTPVVAGGGDVTATALGSGAVADGELHLCASSSSWISGFFDRRVLSVAHSYATITSALGYRPLLIATQESSGSALEWLAEATEPGWAQHGHSLNEFYTDLGPTDPRDPFFLPWLAGERVPVDEERLRGTFYGLSLRHDHKALKRAAIEAVAMNIRWGFEKVAKERGVKKSPVLPLVGGAAGNPLLAQALADVLNRQIKVGNARFSGVLGAAAIAAPAAGWDASAWDAAARIAHNGGPVYDPKPEAVALAEARYGELVDIRRGIVKLYKRSGRRGVR